MRRRKVFTNRDLIFNGYNFSRILYVEEVRQPFASPIQNTLIRTGSTGARQVARLTDSKVIEVDIRLIEKDRNKVEKVKEEIKKRMVTDKPKKLILRGVKHFNMAILDGMMDFSKFHYTGFTTLTFLNPRGISYGDYKKMTVKDGDQVFYEGTLPVKPVIKAKSNSGANQVIFNLEESDSVLRALTDGGAREVVFGEYSEELNHLEKLTIDGNLAMTKWPYTSEFFTLKHGINTIRLNGTNQAELMFWECYL